MMQKFHEGLSTDSGRHDRLRATFDSLIEEFSGVSEFESFRGLLSTTAEKFGQNLSYRLDIDFSAYDPGNLFRSLRIFPKLNGVVQSFDELGTGQEEILALALAVAYAQTFDPGESLILVIDEPEAHLHPLAQQWLASRLNQLAQPGLQVIITTHSPHFVDLARPENLVMVRKPGGIATRVTQVSRGNLVEQLLDSGAHAQFTTDESVGEFYASSATNEIRDALVARMCVLVEGRTEEFAIPELLRSVGFDPLEMGIAIVSVDGLANIAKWLRLFCILETPVYCIFDTDSNKTTQSDIDNSRRARVDIFQALGLDSSVDELVVSDGSPLSSGKHFATLDPYFEKMAEGLLGDEWARHYDESRAVVGPSKPLRARYAAGRIDPDKISEVGMKSLLGLRDALLDKLQVSTDSDDHEEY